MILAAGRGKRMGKLTEHTPKPLLKVGRHSLIEWNILKLAAAGFNDIVINIYHLGQAIIDSLGDGNQYGVTIRYSVESTLLGTGGGIKQALPLLDEAPFLLLSADIWTDFPFGRLASLHPKWAHLVCVNNPPFHPKGDFVIQNNSLHSVSTSEIHIHHSATYASIGVIHPRLFAHTAEGYSDFGALLRQHLQLKHPLTGERYHGSWQNLGTEAQLNHLRENLVQPRTNV